MKAIRALDLKQTTIISEINELERKITESRKAAEAFQVQNVALGTQNQAYEQASKELYEILDEIFLMKTDEIDLERLIKRNTMKILRYRKSLEEFRMASKQKEREKPAQKQTIRSLVKVGRFQGLGETPAKEPKTPRGTENKETSLNEEKCKEIQEKLEKLEEINFHNVEFRSELKQKVLDKNEEAARLKGRLDLLSSSKTHVQMELEINLRKQKVENIEMTKENLTMHYHAVTNSRKDDELSFLRKELAKYKMNGLGLSGNDKEGVSQDSQSKNSRNENQSMGKWEGDRDKRGEVDSDLSGSSRGAKMKEEWRGEQERRRSKEGKTEMRELMDGSFHEEMDQRAAFGTFGGSQEGFSNSNRLKGPEPLDINFKIKKGVGNEAEERELSRSLGDSINDCEEEEPVNFIIPKPMVQYSEEQLDQAQEMVSHGFEENRPVSMEQKENEADSKEKPVIDTADSPKQGSKTPKKLQMGLIKSQEGTSLFAKKPESSRKRLEFQKFEIPIRKSSMKNGENEKTQFSKRETTHDALTGRKTPKRESLKSPAAKKYSQTPIKMRNEQGESFARAKREKSSHEMPEKVVIDTQAVPQKDNSNETRKPGLRSQTPKKLSAISPSNVLSQNLQSKAVFCQVSNESNLLSHNDSRSSKNHENQVEIAPVTPKHNSNIQNSQFPASVISESKMEPIEAPKTPSASIKSESQQDRATFCFETSTRKPNSKTGVHLTSSRNKEKLPSDSSLKKAVQGDQRPLWKEPQPQKGKNDPKESLTNRNKDPEPPLLRSSSNSPPPRKNSEKKPIQIKKLEMGLNKQKAKFEELLRQSERKSQASKRLLQESPLKDQGSQSPKKTTNTTQLPSFDLGKSSLNVTMEPQQLDCFPHIQETKELNLDQDDLNLIESEEV